jgi:hypothetical protein
MNELIMNYYGWWSIGLKIILLVQFNFHILANYECKNVAWVYADSDLCLRFISFNGKMTCSLGLSSLGSEPKKQSLYVLYFTYIRIRQGQQDKIQSHLTILSLWTRVIQWLDSSLQVSQGFSQWDRMTRCYKGRRLATNWGVTFALYSFRFPHN